MSSTVEESDAAMRRRRGDNSTAKVKNKAAAPIQITAEQLIREAQERQEQESKPPKQNITDAEEFAEFKYRKRRGFEDAIRRQRYAINNWLKYAAWEESIREYDRARSVYERAIDVDYKQMPIWIKYAEMEMKAKNVNHARNVWDRAVTLLPRIDQFWYKYTYMEEQLGNFVGARQAFERWMEWHPDEHGWTSFIKFELRHGETERAREIYRRMILAHPKVRTWIKYAKFEEKLGEVARAREVYEEALKYLGEEANDEKLFIAFAKFEQRCKEPERARAIYKYALDHIPKQLAQELYKMFIAFEKQNGDRDAIEDVIVGKRRFQYEEELKVNARNYDAWFDYIRLEETYGEVDRVREVYERAIANLPPAQEKRLWVRYIYLWINYALFEELQTKDVERTRAIYKEIIKLIPHKRFSFSKIWVMYAHFEVRQKNMAGARLVFGQAMGMAPKEKIFKAYIELEQKLGNIDRVRMLYTKYLEGMPANCQAWIKFAELETTLEEFERARRLFEVAIEQPQLDMPELLWKAYIDFEIERDEHERVRALYKRLLDRTKHVKVWISYAQFLTSIGSLDEARGVYEQAYHFLKTVEVKEERVVLVEAWLEFEQGTENNAANVQKVEKMQPKKVKRKRAVKGPDGSDAGWEEYYDYIFPDEVAAAPGLKILEIAHKWKKQRAAAAAGEKKE